MITAQIVGDDRVRAQLREMTPRLRRELARGMSVLLFAMERHVKQVKLQGGNPLHRRSGKLSDSIHVDAPLQTDRGVVGRLYSGRETAVYGRVHEYGGDFLIPTHGRLVTKAFGRVLATPVWAIVRQHMAHFPERSFLRSTMREYAGRFAGMVQAAVGRAQGKATA